MYIKKRQALKLAAEATRTVITRKALAEKQKAEELHFLKTTSIENYKRINALTFFLKDYDPNEYFQEEAKLVKEKKWAIDKNKIDFAAVDVKCITF